MKNLIKNYVNLLTIKNINNFFKNNDIILNENELEYVYKLIKSNWESILVNEKPFINDMYKNVNIENANKIKSVFYYYKDKYKEYLI